MTLASRIAVMDNGHIRQFADPTTIYEDPEDLFVAGFMGSPPMNMLPGKLYRDNGLFVQTRTGSDTLNFPIPDFIADRIKAEDGYEVILGLRPETIFGAGSGLPGEHRFIFERPVDVVEPTGPDTMLVFSIDEHELIARVRPDDAVAPGSIFTFEVEMAKSKLFDAKSGKRI